MTIDREKCILCGECVRDCFPCALLLKNGALTQNADLCNGCGHCIAVCPVSAVSSDEYDMNEVIGLEFLKHDVDPDSLLGLIRSRRTIRRFSDQDVEDEKLIKILEAGRYSATASNRQGNSFIVVTKALAELRALMITSLARYAKKSIKKGADERSLRYSRLFLEMESNFLNDPSGQDKLLFHAPLVIFVASDSVRDGALAASKMELMTYAQGLGMLYSGFCTMAAEDPEVRSFLHIPDEKYVSACLIIGYPNVTYFRTAPRKKLSIHRQ